MFLSSGSSYYSVPLTGTTIKCRSGLVIQSPTIKFNLLSYSDLFKIDLMINSNMNLSDVHEEICQRCILGILHFEDEDIDYINSPAGIFDHIGSKILHHSKDIISNPEVTYNTLVQTVTIFDQLTVFVSRYTSTPIKEVREYPVDKLFKEYCILQTSFPNELQPIAIQEEQYSKVGG